MTTETRKRTARDVKSIMMNMMKKYRALGLVATTVGDGTTSHVST